MSARSRYRPWWLDGAERPGRALALLAPPTADIELKVPRLSLQAVAMIHLQRQWVMEVMRRYTALFYPQPVTDEQYAEFVEACDAAITRIILGRCCR